MTDYDNKQTAECNFQLKLDLDVSTADSDITITKVIKFLFGSVCRWRSLQLAVQNTQVLLDLCQQK